jgi:hypothetical protein
MGAPGVTKALLAALVVVAAVGYLAAACGGSTQTVTEVTTVLHTTTVRVTTTVAAAGGSSGAGATACTGDAMAGTFRVIPGSAGAGQIGYRLRVTNASPVACYVSGLPDAQLLRAAGADLPTNVVAAQPGQSTSTHVVLEPNDAATADARFSPDVPGGSEPTDAACEPKAFTLRLAFGGAPLDVNVTPPTPVCERGTLQFTTFSAG